MACHLFFLNKVLLEQIHVHLFTCVPGCIPITASPPHRKNLLVITPLPWAYRGFLFSIPLPVLGVHLKEHILSLHVATSGRKSGQVADRVDLVFSLCPRSWS